MEISGNYLPETEIFKLLDQIRGLIEKYENDFIDGIGIERLIRIRHKLFDLQMKRFSAYINEIAQCAIIPEEDEKLQREMMNLMVRLNDIIEG
jgi:hypothetical protein